MAIRMASIKRSASGSWSTRKVIPEDVRERYGKREEKKTWPASFSETDVRSLFTAWQHQVENQIAILRTGNTDTTETLPLDHAPSTNPRGLSRSEHVALRVKWHDWLSERFWDQPDDTVESWLPALELSLPQDTDALPDHRGRFAWTIFDGLGLLIEEFLAQQTLTLTEKSYDEYRWQAVDAYRDFATSVIHHLNGTDHCAPSGQQEAILQAVTQPTPAPAPPPTSRTLSDLLSGYVRERQPAAATVKKFTAHIEHLKDFLGHENAGAITKQDIQKWKDHLLHEKGLAGKTVREGYLAAAKVVFNWGKENDLIGTNPASDVKVRAPKVQKLRDKGLTTEEAQMILHASLQYQNPPHRTSAAVRRWAPWLCAYTGARINEITQLRSKDLRLIDGVYCINITPEAGSVKTGEARDVPLHDHLIQQGILDWIAGTQGQLFYDPTKGRGGTDAHPQSKKAGERLARWVRELGVDDPNVSPNHGWRHRFKTEARLAGINTEASDQMTGHSAVTEGGKYGKWKASALKAQLDKLPQIDLQ